MKTKATRDVVGAVLSQLASLSEVELLAFTRGVFTNPKEKPGAKKFLTLLRRNPRHHVVKKIVGKFDLESRQILKKMSQSEITEGDPRVLLRSIGSAKITAKKLYRRWQKGRLITIKNRASMKSSQYDSPFDSYLGVKPPAAFTSPKSCKKKILLHRVTPDMQQFKSLTDCIADRVSYREINGKEISLVDLSWLLWATQGVKKFAADGQAHFRNVPSGGSRHAFDTYLFINRVTGVTPGLYFYEAKTHRLLSLSEGDFRPPLRRAVNGQIHLSQAAVYWVWAATPYRSEWRYGVYARKDMLIECGHICQNLYLMAEALNLGVCAASGYHQDYLDELIGLDGENEFAVYTASLTKP